MREKGKQLGIDAWLARCSRALPQLSQKIQWKEFLLAHHFPVQTSSSIAEVELPQ